MKSADLRQGDIIAAELAGQTACFHIRRISRSWWRRKRPFLIVRPIYTNALSGLLIERTKLWCEPEVIDETLKLDGAFVFRDGKRIDAGDVS